MTNHSSPITTRAATLAPTNVDVRSCQAGSSSLESSPRSSLPVTAFDSSRARQALRRSTALRDDVAREELQMVEIGHVEKLEVDAFDAGLGIRRQLVGDLRGRADDGGV